MQHGIVEGETGIFPAPVVQVVNRIKRLFGRKNEPTVLDPQGEPGEMPPFPERPPDTPKS